jgi:hypothetical protein
MPLRTLMAPGLVVVLLVSVCFAQGQFEFDKAHYVMRMAGSEKFEAVPGVLRFDGAKKEVQFVETKGTPVFSLKYEEIKGMLYEEAAKPRYAAGLLLGGPLLLTKSKKHFLTFHYIDVAGTPQYAIIHLDKSNVQEALARAESETGKKVERIEQHGRE